MKPFKGWACASPPTVWTLDEMARAAFHGCKRKLGHTGMHWNAMLEWSDTVEPRRRFESRGQQKTNNS